MRLSSYEIKAKLCHYIMKRTKFYIGGRCNYDYVKKNFWDAPNVDKQLAAIYDASYVRYKTIRGIQRSNFLCFKFTIPRKENVFI